MHQFLHHSIKISTAARLHMGFFDLHGGLGRKFGSIGLSLTAPNLELTARHHDQILVTGNEAVTSRVAKIAEQLLTKLSLSKHIHLDIQKHIPEHAGLGSGTQLALAIGTVISRLFELNLSTSEIAILCGRGNRSGIGIAAFDHGGILIDGGRLSPSQQTSQKSQAIPPLLARYIFPEQWRILLILDTTQPGIHGQEELTAFSQLPAFSEDVAAHLCRHVLMQAMPALIEQDLPAFGQSIQVLQAHVGDYFAPAQGGRYASARVGTVLEHLKNVGVDCFGQSSWGPTGFAVFESAEAAEKQLQQLKTIFTDSALNWMICSPNNQGAVIETIADNQSVASMIG
ncbi:MAG TPA: beta-ribofuranosylaminobenzene 5'-phosphate synthase family protein [Methylotenera sp.]|nr:beta-ribofuranosylaminobenzene 5'-phosphate synthase family protein [Methylotenera sp.]